MTRSAISRTFASAIVISLLTTGCTLLGGNQTAVTSAEAAPPVPRIATAPSVAKAEAAVVAAPTDPSRRVALGDAYLAGGRLLAARQAYADAIDLGATGTRAVIGLVLGQIAAGQGDAAVNLIEAHRATLPASDAGLALALAGDTRRAIIVLQDAAQGPDADARVRQNLALAYALAGQWAHSRIYAAQDLEPEAVRVRMAEWTKLAGANDGATRIAAMLSLPRVDPVAMPAALALNDDARVGNSLALAVTRADPAPIAQFAPPPPADFVAPSVEIAEAASPVPAPAPVAAPQPTARRDTVVLRAPAAPYRARPATPDRLIVARVGLPPLVKAKPGAAKQVAAPKVVRSSQAPQAAFNPAKPRGWAAQLGAYASLAQAKAAWAVAVRRHPGLAAYPASSHVARVNGRVFYRLTVNGLPSRQAALGQCRTVAAKGGACLVRQMAGSEAIRWVAQPTPARMVMAGGRRTASR